MAASDIQHVTSASTGSSGGAIAAGPVVIVSGVSNNVWPNIDATERLAGGLRLRKTFFLNTHATEQFPAPVLYTPVLPLNATLQIGFGINHTSDDDYLQGNMAAWSAAAKVALISDGADTRVVTIVGLDNTGTPVPVTENVTLTGAVEVLSVATFTKVWAVYVASVSASRTVLVKQGAAGTTRGTIGLNKIICWLWVTAGTTIGAGISLLPLVALQSFGIWRKLSWIAGAAVTRPNTLTIKMEEKT